MGVVAVRTAVTRTLSCAVAAAAPSSLAKSLPNCLSSSPSAGGVGVATWSQHSPIRGELQEVNDKIVTYLVERVAVPAIEGAHELVNV